MRCGVGGLGGDLVLIVFWCSGTLVVVLWLCFGVSLLVPSL